MESFCRVALSAALRRRYLALVPATIDIAIEPPDQPEFIALLAELDSYLTALYPPESTYILDVASLRAPDIRFFVAREDAAPEIRPFGEYAADGPHSRFLAKSLAPAD